MNICSNDNQIQKLYIEAQKAHSVCKYHEAHELFSDASKKAEFKPLNDFYCVLYMSYYNNLGYVPRMKNEYKSKMNDISNHIESGKIQNSDVLKYLQPQCGLYYLAEGDYFNNYIKFLSPVTNHKYNIRPETMSILSEKSKDKTQLIYFNGGIGDKIMYSRFIDRVISVLHGNKIVLLVDNSLYWIFSFLYGNNSNVKVTIFNDNIQKFDSHCSIQMLSYFLKIGFDDIYENRFLSKLSSINSQFLYSLSPSKWNVIINWKGSNENDKRDIALSELCPLFELKGINWISVQKNIVYEEREIMKKYNICNLENIDSGGNAFFDTISILNKVDLVITIDTSIIHIAGSMDNVKCYLLLNASCDWRWLNSRWYPDVKIFQQKVPCYWEDVVDDVKSKLTERFDGQIPSKIGTPSQSFPILEMYS